MKKTVMKTALITLASIVGAFVILFFSLFFFSPVTVGKFFDDMGNYGASVYFYERQYNKTGNISDLATLVFKLDEERDSKKTYDYTYEIKEKSDFISYCQQKDEKDYAGKTDYMTTREFILGKLVISAVLSDNFAVALSVANDYVSQKGYTAYNPYRIMLSRTASALSVANLNVVKGKLQDIQAEKTGAELALVTSDINYIESIINS